MNKTLNIALKIIALIVFIISAIWWFKQPGYDSILATLTALSAFIGLFFVNTHGGGPEMKQNGGDNSTMYQSNGPMTIN